MCAANIECCSDRARNDRELAYVVELGVIEVFVGRSSADLLPAGSVTVTLDPSGTPPDKAFVVLPYADHSQVPTSRLERQLSEFIAEFGQGEKP